MPYDARCYHFNSCPRKLINILKSKCIILNQIPYGSQIGTKNTKYELFRLQNTKYAADSVGDIQHPTSCHSKFHSAFNFIQNIEAPRDCFSLNLRHLTLRILPIWNMSVTQRILGTLLILSAIMIYLTYTPSDPTYFWTYWVREEMALLKLSAATTDQI